MNNSSHSVLDSRQGHPHIKEQFDDWNIFFYVHNVTFKGKVNVS